MATHTTTSGGEARFPLDLHASYYGGREERRWCRILHTNIAAPAMSQTAFNNAVTVADVYGQGIMRQLGAMKSLHTLRFEKWEHFIILDVTIHTVIIFSSDFSPTDTDWPKHGVITNGLRPFTRNLVLNLTVRPHFPHFDIFDEDDNPTIRQIIDPPTWIDNLVLIFRPESATAFEYTTYDDPGDERISPTRQLWDHILIHLVPFLCRNAIEVTIVDPQYIRAPWRPTMTNAGVAAIFKEMFATAMRTQRNTPMFKVLSKREYLELVGRKQFILEYYSINDRDAMGDEIERQVELLT